jgi:hypothetical protein
MIGWHSIPMQPPSPVGNEMEWRIVALYTMNQHYSLRRYMNYSRADACPPYPSLNIKEGAFLS